jgi:hypothetical protein
MKVNLNKNYVDLEGRAVVDASGKLLKLNEELAQGLSQAQEKENPLRLWELSKKIYAAKEAIDIDVSDVELIKKHVKSGTFTTAFCGQVLEALVENS